MGTRAQGQSPFGVIDITAKHDVGTELGLGPVKIKLLCDLAKAGSEMPFSWDVFATRAANAKSRMEHDTIIAAREATVDLINLGLVREVEYYAGATLTRSVLRLTDKGKSVVAEHEKFILVPGTMKPISPEEIIKP